MANQPPQPGDREAKQVSGGDPSSRVLVWATGAALLGAFLIFNSVDATDAAPPAPAAAARATAPAAAPPAGAAPLPASRPTLLTIPGIGVSAPFTPLHIGKSGKLDPPPADNSNLVGWYEDGPSPGESGNSIVAGHVDTRTGPAVFFLLDMVKPGSTAEITRADGTVAKFKVDSVEVFSKDHFPDERVYADTPNAQLRIITCGGAYDQTKKDYTDNVVVFAHLDSADRR
ncbi:class F sortase [Streptomyces sp. NPDC006733]|uniref:class F sortase n=1 Tax=Streptomyces sp. NPDC006733 TaxID=3155460 RepID=UPI0033E5C55A